MALNPRLNDWRGQVVWVVGASSGIGLATAKALHAQGAVVVVSARNAAALQTFVDTHAGSHAAVLDVGRPATVAAAMAKVLALNGSIDLMLYCAGHYQAMRAQDFDLAEMQRHVDINYIGALRVLDKLLPQMLRQGHGHISLVASVAGWCALPNAIAYGPTKAALQHLAQTLYMDLKPAGVAVSVINPGFVETGLTANNSFKMPSLITPEQAATHMLQGWARGRFDIHFPKRFSLWLKLLRLLPNGLYFPIVRRATST